jgi:hypothetical protein
MAAEYRGNVTCEENISRTLPGSHDPRIAVRVVGSHPPTMAIDEMMVRGEPVKPRGNKKMVSGEPVKPRGNKEMVSGEPVKPRDNDVRMVRGVPAKPRGNKKLRVDEDNPLACDEAIKEPFRGKVNHLEPKERVMMISALENYIDLFKNETGSPRCMNKGHHEI